MVVNEKRTDDVGNGPWTDRDLSTMTHGQLIDAAFILNEGRRNTVKVDALINMPPGQPIEIALTQDMDQRPRRAIVWQWASKHGPRKSYFCADSGEYIGEAF